MSTRKHWSDRLRWVDPQKLLWVRRKTGLGSKEDAEKMKPVTEGDLRILHNLI